MSALDRTQLPKRNGLLTFLYAVLTVFMFLFFGYIITTGDVYVGLGYSAQLEEQYADYDWDGKQTAQASVTPSQLAVPTDQKPVQPTTLQFAANPTASVAEPAQPKPAKPNDYLSAFFVAGLSRTLDINAANEKELMALWNGIYEAGFPRRLNQVQANKTVVVVYSDYNHAAQTVRVTVGYRVADASQPDTANVVKVAAGRYEAKASHGADSVLLHWAENASRQDLLFNTDFEEHEVDAWLQPQKSTVYLGKR